MSNKPKKVSIGMYILKLRPKIQHRAMLKIIVRLF